MTIDPASPKRIVFRAVLLAVPVFLAVDAAGQQQEQTAEQLRRLDALQQRIDRLSVDQDQAWLTEQRAGEIRRLVADVIADADTRASLLDDGDFVGWDDEFRIESADGTFELELAGRIQFRFIYNRQEGEDVDRNRVGFEARRVRLEFEGRVVNPRVRYSITLDLDEDTGLGNLNDATIEYRLSDDWTVQAGHFRAAMLREMDVSSKRQLLVERSLVSREFSQDRSYGVALRHDGDRVGLSLGLMDTSDDFFANESWSVVGRAELLLAGEDRDPFEDFTSFPDDDPGLLLGVGGLYQDIDERDFLGDEDERILRWSADLSAELGGANAFAAIIGNHVDEEDEDQLTQWGVVVQGGIFIADNLELFAQYAWGDGDDETTDLNVVTVGVNRYFHRHHLKWTLDIGYGLDPVDDLWDSDGAGWREDEDGEDGQVVVRSQIQLLF